MQVTVVDNRRSAVADFSTPFINAHAALQEFLHDYADRLFVENGEKVDGKYDLNAYHEMEAGSLRIANTAKAEALACQVMGQGEKSVEALESALLNLKRLREEFLTRGLVIGRMY